MPKETGTFFSLTNIYLTVQQLQSTPEGTSPYPTARPGTQEGEPLFQDAGTGVRRNPSPNPSP